MTANNKTKVKIRYFLITYFIGDEKGFRFGDMTFSYRGFPERSFINKRISKAQLGTTTNIINSIYEFKNKADYKSFRDGGK